MGEAYIIFQACLKAETMKLISLLSFLVIIVSIETKNNGVENGLNKFDSEHLSQQKQQDCTVSFESEDIAVLKQKVESLEAKNLQLEDDLEYYSKQNSFLYKCLGGQMIEFVLTLIIAVGIIKISDILIMVTDILEEVVIPIVRTGPVYSMQSKKEAGVIF